MATLKYSRQRESIKEFLRTRTDHPTADAVYENMKLIYPNISLGCLRRKTEFFTVPTGSVILPSGKKTVS